MAATRATNTKAAAARLLLLACAAALAKADTKGFATWYVDDHSDDSCGFGPRTVTGLNSVAIRSDNWAWGAPAGAAPGTLCGACFMISCDPGATTFGMAGSYCQGPVLVQITNTCPECTPGQGWGACTDCTGVHVDIRKEVYTALTGCNPDSGTCSMPGILPVTISDPVPCPSATPAIIYRSSEAYFQSFQISNVDRVLATPALTLTNGAVSIREQPLGGDDGNPGGRIYAMDATQLSQLPGTLELAIHAADGSTAMCSVPAGAAGGTFDCAPWNSGPSAGAGLGGGMSANDVDGPDPAGPSPDAPAGLAAQYPTLFKYWPGREVDGQRNCYNWLTNHKRQKCLQAQGLVDAAAQAGRRLQSTRA